MIERWKNYLDFDFPVPTTEDRRALEVEIGHTLPQSYWSVVSQHQGHIPDPDGVPRPDGRPDERVGVFLYVLSPDKLEDAEVFGYGVSVALGNMADLYPPGIVPFSDDTGGNNLAFDFRTGPDPAIVFVDHNVAGERGLTRVAPNFAALLALLR